MKIDQVVAAWIPKGAVSLFLPYCEAKKVAGIETVLCLWSRLVVECEKMGSKAEKWCAVMCTAENLE